MALDMENWFDNMDENTAQPSAFGFEDGTTDAVLTEVSLFQSRVLAGRLYSLLLKTVKGRQITVIAYQFRRRRQTVQSCHQRLGNQTCSSSCVLLSYLIRK